MSGADIAWQKMLLQLVGFVKIVKRQRPIAAGTSPSLSCYFEILERFWMNLQLKYNLDIEQDRLKERLDEEVQVYVRAE